MNIGRTLRRTIRPVWVAGLAAAAWVNRRELRAAVGRGKRSDAGRTSVVVPAAGETVMVRTTTATWAEPRRRFHRRTTVGGHPANPVSAGAAASEKPATFEKEV